MYILLSTIILSFFVNVEIKPQSNRFSFDYDCSMQMKGFAILLVILGHLNTEFYNWKFMHSFGTIGVAMFLFISGYGLVKSYQRDKLDNFGKKRILTVFLPYSLVTFIWLIVDYLLNIKHNILNSFLALIGFDFTRSVDSTMWYITFILFWYIAFFLTFKLVNKNYIRVFVLFFFSGVSLLFWITNFVGGASYQWGVHALIFPLGVFYATYGEHWILKYKLKILIPVSILAGVFYYLNYLDYLSYLTLKSDVLYYMILDVFGLVFILFSLLIIRGYGFIFLFLDRIGKYSYELYLVEGYLISKIIKSGAIENQYKLIIYLCTLCILALIVKKLILLILKGKLNRLMVHFSK